MFRSLKKLNTEIIKEISQELDVIRRKTDAISINFIGIGGKLNGLNILHSETDEFPANYYAGLFSDTFSKIKKLSLESVKEEVDSTIISTNSCKFLFIPINNTIIFSCISKSEKSIKKIEEWIIKNQPKLKSLLDI